MPSTWQWPPHWRRTRQQVFATKGRRCHWCGAYATTVDHVIPAALGGPHTLANLVPACRSCNCSRGAALSNRIRPRRPLTPKQRRAIAWKKRQPYARWSSLTK